jgi:hypothetical protein
MKFKAMAMGLVLMGVLAGRVSAQTFNVGIEAGANFSNFIGSGVSSISSANGSKLGLVGGGFICLNFGNSFALRPEVLYAQKGNQVTGTSTTTQLDYIEIPVLLKLSLGTPVVNPGILIGPAFAWNVIAKDATGGNIPNISTSDVGLVVGLEVDIDKFLVSGRYELGFNNVAQNVNVQNGTITLLAGYSFM